MHEGLQTPFVARILENFSEEFFGMRRSALRRGAGRRIVVTVLARGGRKNAPLVAAVGGFDNRREVEEICRSDGLHAYW